jgi:hypothetical protein
MGLLIGKKTLLVHIPKTGGSTMIRNFKANSPCCEWEGAHSPLSNLHNKCKAHNIDPADLHVVSVVRNPWTKMFSTWRYFSTINFTEYYSGDAKVDTDFNRWVKWIYTDFDRNKKDRGRDRWNMFKYLYTDQTNWFKDEDGNTLKVDNLLKTEELTKNISQIAEQYGWDNYLVTVNKTKSSVPDYYEETYNQESIDLVAKYFSEDITQFKYDFEGG